MKFLLTLRLLLVRSMNYLLAQDVPTSTESLADGVRVALMTLLATLLLIVVTLPDRLLIFLMLIAPLLAGALIIWMF